jgi:hypothetical protein
MVLSSMVALNNLVEETSCYESRLRLLCSPGKFNGNIVIVVTGSHVWTRNFWTRPG